jgi:hypothetical protein
MAASSMVSLTAGAQFTIGHFTIGGAGSPTAAVPVVLNERFVRVDATTI